MRFVLLDPYGDYGDGEVDSIPGVGALPGWVAARFAVPAAARAAGR
jgi:hypothetical protein